MAMKITEDLRDDDDFSVGIGPRPRQLLKSGNTGLRKDVPPTCESVPDPEPVVFDPDPPAKWSNMSEAIKASRRDLVYPSLNIKSYVDNLDIWKITDEQLFNAIPADLSQDQYGNFPFVKLLSARKTISVEMLNFVNRCASGQFPLEEEVARLRAEYKISKEEDSPTTPTVGTSTDTPAPAPRRKSTGEDHRGSDYSAALKAAWSGLEGEELEAFVFQNSMHVVDPCGYDMNPEDYIRKTAENAAAAVAEAKANFTPRYVQPDTGHRHNGAKNYLAKKTQFILKRQQSTPPLPTP